MSGPYIAMIAFVLISTFLTSHMSAAWRLDCSKFVFAPKCRGVAAKRAGATDTMQLLDGKNYISEATLRKFGDRLSAVREPNASSLADGQDQDPARDPGRTLKQEWLGQLSDRDIKNLVSQASEARRADSKQLMGYLLSLANARLPSLATGTDDLSEAYEEGYAN